MIKLREAKYCNLKLFLIILVVYGHLIEPQISESEVLMTQYRLIYFIHMPVFSFLSGLFIKKEKDCLIQLKRIIPMYLILQIAAVLLGKGEVNILTPFWHLWYLLSYCTWLCIAMVWFRWGKESGKSTILVGTIVIACVVGYIPMIGRTFSLSRTIVFFPYFWIGMICETSLPWKKLRKAAMFLLPFLAVLLYYFEEAISTEFLYHAEAYENMEEGWLLRLLCYCISGMMGLIILAFIPAKRYAFTKVGTDTMWIYLFHAPIVFYLREWNISWPFLGLITVTLIYIIYILMRWNSNLYGIVAIEGRGSRWPHFKKFTKNMRSQSIASYYP